MQVADLQRFNAQSAAGKKNMRHADAPNSAAGESPLNFGKQVSRLPRFRLMQYFSEWEKKKRLKETMK